MEISSRNDPRWWRWLAALVMLGAGAYYGWLTARPAFASWFIREDSRFFANGIFSFYDLLAAFGTRMNSMGQYRPIIRPLWGFPAWLGHFDPVAYHGVSLSILLLTSFLLARFVYLYFGKAYAALWAGAVFFLLPANLKPLYWISAWHNSAAVLFSVAACVFRVELWRRPSRSRALRVLSLFSFYLALASREVAFGLSAVLLLIDLLEDRGREQGELGLGRAVRRSGDLAALTVSVFAFVFLVESPFRRAGLHLGSGGLAHPLGMLSLFWRYAYGIFWAVSDVITAPPPGSFAIFTGVLIALTLAGSFLRRPLGLGTLLATLGIAPFLLIGATAVEYGETMALGFAFVLGGLLSLLDEKLPRLMSPLFLALSVAGLAQLYSAGADVRRFYAHDFVKESGELEAFIEKLRVLSASEPPFRAIEITRIDEATRATLGQTMHFLHPGIDELVPERVFLFTNATLGILDGLGLNDPGQPFWRAAMKNAFAPVRVEYDGNGFRSAHD